MHNKLKRIKQGLLFRPRSINRPYALTYMPFYKSPFATAFPTNGFRDSVKKLKIAVVERKKIRLTQKRKASFFLFLKKLLLFDV